MNLPSLDFTVKPESAELHIYLLKPESSNKIAKQKGWSDSITRLLQKAQKKSLDLLLLPEAKICLCLVEDSEAEKVRLLGNRIWKKCKELNINSIHFGHSDFENEINCHLLEGLFLSTYSFKKYKSEKNDESNPKFTLSEGIISEKQKLMLEASCKGNFVARDLVNEPYSFLSAPQLSKEIEKYSKEAGFKFEYFDLNKIKSLKMGGLLAVNAGSHTPPTFNILTYKPENPINSNPLVLVGKGVVYDTGGMSLKPTANSMDKMKSDMGGAASVVGSIYSIAKAKLPYYVVGLIPATDNRPGNNAIVPSDVITMHDGTTVEVMNTDAEGRLILADALSYAKKFKPSNVIDFATLTGSAARAIGSEGMVMLNNDQGTKLAEKLIESGDEIHERIAPFPNWPEYANQLKSDVADLKNIGGPSAGAITAGKFLEHFVDFPWIHLDIAGMAFLDAADGYRPKNGTGVGARLIFNLLEKNRI